MIRAVVDCDGCHARDVAEAQVLYVNVADSEDGVYRLHQSRLQRVDLCPKCLATALSRLVNRLEHAERRDWVRQYVAEEPPT
jgi:hypothetical protein